MAVSIIFGKLLGDQRKLFWICHGSYWFIVWLAQFFFEPDLRQTLHNFIYHTESIIVGFILSLLLRDLYRKHKWHQIPWFSLISLTTVSSGMTAIIWYFAFRVIYSTHLGFLTFFDDGLDAFLKQIWFHSFGIMLWSVLYLGFKIWNEWNQQAIQVEREHTLLKSAQLEMLRYQLNPHFLFNTLSSLRALVHIDANKAEAMITQVSEFLRYSLLEGNNNEVPLSREIEIIKYYLEIESIRFKENLRVEFNIDPNSENYPIPMFLIHPLVENAIKYGMKTSSMPLHILVTTNLIDDQLQIEVKNTGRWIENQSQTGKTQKGIGLENVRKRLEHSYPDNHAMEITKNDDLVSVRMRFRKGP